MAAQSQAKAVASWKALVCSAPQDVAEEARLCCRQGLPDVEWEELDTPSFCSSIRAT